MDKPYIAHNIKFHTLQFETIKQFMEYRKAYIPITQIFWIPKQPFVTEHGITESNAAIIITLN